MTTTTGENRAAYAAEHPKDPRPSRFANDGADYRAWAARADAWAGAPFAMVTEYVNDDDGTVYARDSTTSHGWRSPGEAVESWTRRGDFDRPNVKPYRGGKAEKREGGYTIRTYFEAVTA